MLRISPVRNGKHDKATIEQEIQQFSQGNVEIAKI